MGWFFGFLAASLLQSPIGLDNREEWIYVGVLQEKGDLRIGYTFCIVAREHDWKIAKISIKGRDFPLFADTELPNIYYQKVFTLIRNSKVGDPIPRIEIKNPRFFGEIGESEISNGQISFVMRFYDANEELLLCPSTNKMISPKLKMFVQDPSKADDPLTFGKATEGVTLKRKNPIRRNELKVIISKRKTDYVIKLVGNDQEILRGSTFLLLDSKTSFSRTVTNGKHTENFRLHILKR